MKQEAIQIAKQWMTDIVETVSKRMFNEHMDLISKKVHVSGIPGFEGLGYNDWFNQCKHEFEDKVVQSVSYQGLKLLASNESQIMFKTYETVEATDGHINAQGIEVLLENEEGNWRVVQERILTPEEVKHDKLLD